MAKITDMDADDFFKQFAAAAKGESTGGLGYSGSRGGARGGDPEAFKKSIEQYTKEIKASISSLDTWKGILDGQQQSMVDITKTMEELDEEIAHLKATGEDTAAAELENTKKKLKYGTALKNATAVAANFGIGMIKVANQMVDASIAYAQGLLSGGDGIQVATQMYIASIKAAGETSKLTGDAIGGLGSIVMMFGGIWGKILGAAMSLLGPLLGKVAERAAELEAKRAEILGAELIKTRKTFQEATSAGAMFAGGMGEMRREAARAGLTLQDFSDLITKNTASLASMGLNMTDAVKRIGGVSKVLREGQLGTELQNLGISIKDQAGLAAETAASLQASGQLRGKSDADVARLTVQYGKDLKVIQEITGEDAKKKLEQARKEALAADIRTQLLRTDPTGEGLRRFERVFATVPDEMKTGFLQSVASGGKAITDVATNVAMANQPAIATYLKATTDLVNNSSVTASQAGDLAVGIYKTAGETVKNSSANFSQVAFAARMTGDSMLTGATGMVSKFTEAGIRMEGLSIEAARKYVDDLAKTKDPLTNTINALDAALNKQTVALEQTVAKDLPGFATSLAGVSATMDKLAALASQTADAAAKAAPVAAEVEKVGADVGTIGKWGMLAGTLMSIAGGAMVATGVGAIPGAALLSAGVTTFTGSMATTTAGSVIEGGAKLAQGKPAFADGGVATGPNSGYDANLHGTEAVVPLPNGRSIPVQMAQAADPKAADRMYKVLQTNFDKLLAGTQATYITNANLNKEMQASLERISAASQDTAKTNNENIDKSLQTNFDKLLAGTQATYITNASVNKEMQASFDKISAASQDTAKTNNENIDKSLQTNFDKLLTSIENIAKNKDSGTTVNTGTVVGAAVGAVAGPLGIAIGASLGTMLGDYLKQPAQEATAVARETNKKTTALPTGPTVDNNVATAATASQDTKSYIDTTIKQTLAAKAREPSGMSDESVRKLSDLLQTQITKADEMITKLAENVDINQRILTHAYS